ncbi:MULTISPECIES: hypothetical protein [Streptomycetaceae]|uniref:Uncharacterized protein n=1 Tax=Streptantibioticus cattleyicolor (strain ATCC 35852 / DSM 46488 / JCM 4925 / NBRC 14057 / NRRL 8057) TaxID=1003195 RepID=F8JZR0_STREN|nr:hypothetical protein [Streptantibioticus cattleyicolor]AEW94348.1 hypothetical protein SCATT_19770 [Streptantibioticus cattleyicolor NRRL 8057 = DSM 46488]CCB74705.1 exported protein of unknown function [Streptantibioticus cattleyicolor NRRL 8057 = DSM 46488]
MRRRDVRAVAEVAGWWAGLLVLWLMLISTVDVLETAIGAVAALLGAVSAYVARRAVTG